MPSDNEKNDSAATGEPAELLSPSRLIAKGILQLAASFSLGLIPLSGATHVVLVLLDIDSPVPGTLLAGAILLGLLDGMFALGLLLVPHGIHLPRPTSWDPEVEA